MSQRIYLNIEYELFVFSHEMRTKRILRLCNICRNITRKYFLEIVIIILYVSIVIANKRNDTWMTAKISKYISFTILHPTDGTREAAICINST